jgi:hypothetical protein
MMTSCEVIIPVATHLLQDFLQLKGGAVESFPKGNIGDAGVSQER